MSFDSINRFKTKQNDDPVCIIKKSEALESLIIAEKKDYEKIPKRIQKIPKTIHHNNAKLSHSPYSIYAQVLNGKSTINP